MNPQDLTNGCFELLGGFFILLSIIRLKNDKSIRGINWLHPTFFTAWGWWNIYYYPHLGQWASLVGGIFIVALNTAWVSQMVYYININRNAPNE